MYALDATSGDMLWEFETGGDVYSSPAVGPTVYVGSIGDTKVRLVNPQDCESARSLRVETDRAMLRVEACAEEMDCN